MIQIFFRYHAITAKLIQSILNIQVPEILVQIENWYIQRRFNFSLCCSYICTSRMIYEICKLFRVINIHHIIIVRNYAIY